MKHKKSDCSQAKDGLFSWKTNKQIYKTHNHKSYAETK